MNPLGFLLAHRRLFCSKVFFFFFFYIQVLIKSLFLNTFFCETYLRNGRFFVGLLNTTRCLLVDSKKKLSNNVFSKR